ncbi:MAG: rhomboid family intramembrane serine protease [Prevotella sp.]|uniref:rhomboid family intramembrane serine protease n=1 Tax=Prevotella sp. TaxID=59823 RepID=UPI002A2A272B|nr:rhomboid family intramembrane serine protease [Prevotella sp.]MDD7318925.1 rhomboid family intramembrane serine protease [Prevotellaceae bacterium]MDY4019951.1 rhomboid family intramembrane serine protease [Prevotella sp.]
MRGIPTVTKNLLIINVLAFLATWVFEMRGIELSDYLGLHFFMASDFKFYQLFTYMFMHGGFQHIFFNMFALWMFGVVVEHTWGAKKFLLYYIACGIGAGLVQELVQYSHFVFEGMAAFDRVTTPDGFVMPMDEYLNMWNTVGASGAIYGILLAFGMLYPEQRIFIFPLPVPIKAKWFVLIYVAIELFSALGTSSDGVAHFAHLGGMLFGWLIIKYWKNHPGSDSYLGNGEQFFDNMKRKWEKRKEKDLPKNDYNDRGYDERKKENDEETDRILDKIKRSGYDSLTAEEKRRLFDNGNK